MKSLLQSMITSLTARVWIILLLLTPVQNAESASLTIHPAKSMPGTGFLFPEASPASLAYGIQRALDTYRDGEVWKSIQREGMGRDFSWDRFAIQYVKLFKRLIKVKKASLKG